MDIIGRGADAVQAVGMAVKRVEALVNAMAVISPVVFRNITGLGLDYHSPRELKDAAAMAAAIAKTAVAANPPPFNPPVPGCQGRSVLILGSGMVVGPCVDVIVDSGASVTLASNDLAAAQALVEPHRAASAHRNKQSLQAVPLDMVRARVAKRKREKKKRGLRNCC